MFPEQAKEIMETVVKDSRSNPGSINRCMNDRWYENVDDYLPMILHLLFNGIEPFVLVYIKEKCPEAWFRPIFDRNHPLRIKYEEENKNE
jgi:hypothetical protein